MTVLNFNINTAGKTKLIAGKNRKKNVNVGERIKKREVHEAHVFSSKCPEDSAISIQNSAVNTPFSAKTLTAAC